MDKFYYAVYHCWEKDHYNAQVWVNDLLCVFDSLEKAEEFKKKYEKPTDSYGWSKRGRIAIKALPATYDETTFWWLKKETLSFKDEIPKEEFKSIPKSKSFKESFEEFYK